MEMKGIVRSIGTGLAGLTWLLAVTGCTRNGEEQVCPEQRQAIDFTPLVSRAVVTALGDGDAFAVWADKSRDGESRVILTQEEVYCTGGTWSYDHICYWEREAVYDFYALYPHDTPNAELRESGTGGNPRLSVTDFDTRDGHDLMCAEQTGIRYEGSPAPVKFTFRHLLSKVEIVGRIDPALATGGVSARIVSAKLFGLPATGSCTVAAGSDASWEPGAPTTADAPFRSTGEVALSTTGSSLFGEMLPFPQTLNDEVQLEIVYQYNDPNQTENRFTRTVRLADTGLTAWEPGMGYRYVFTVGSEYILFAKPEVVPWQSASGGSVTVE